MNPPPKIVLWTMQTFSLDQKRAEKILLWGALACVVAALFYYVHSWQKPPVKPADFEQHQHMPQKTAQ